MKCNSAAMFLADVVIARALPEIFGVLVVVSQREVRRSFPGLAASVSCSISNTRSSRRGMPIWSVFCIRLGRLRLASHRTRPRHRFQATAQSSPSLLADISQAAPHKHHMDLRFAERRSTPRPYSGSILVPGLFPDRKPLLNAHSINFPTSNKSYRGVCLKRSTLNLLNDDFCKFK